MTLAQRLSAKALEKQAYKIASKATSHGPVPIQKLDSIFKTAKAALEAGDSEDAALEKTIAYVETIKVST